MQLSELKRHLAEFPENNVQFLLPTGTKVPAHAHVTDVARIDKKFIDCGGTFRTETSCRLQTWFADDTDHRIKARTLLKILDKAASFLESDGLDVEIEYEAPFISQFPISHVESDGSTLLIHLGIKHTACLASDACGTSTPKKTSAPATANILFKPLASLKTSKCC